MHLSVHLCSANWIKWEHLGKPVRETGSLIKVLWQQEFFSGKCSTWWVTHTSHGQNFTLLSSDFMVFLRWMRLALAFCYLGITCLFTLSHAASEQPQVSDYQRFDLFSRCHSPLC